MFVYVQNRDRPWVFFFKSCPPYFWVKSFIRVCGFDKAGWTVSSGKRHVSTSSVWGWQACTPYLAWKWWRLGLAFMIAQQALCWLNYLLAFHWPVLSPNDSTFGRTVSIPLFSWDQFLVQFIVTLVVGISLAEVRAYWNTRNGSQDMGIDDGTHHRQASLLWKYSIKNSRSGAQPTYRLVTGM